MHGGTEEPDSFKSVSADVLGLGTHLFLCVILFPSPTFGSYSIKGQEGTLHPHIFGIKTEMLSSLQAFNSMAWYPLGDLVPFGEISIPGLITHGILLILCQQLACW